MNKPSPNFTFLKEKIDIQRNILLQGSTRSGKTWAIIYFLIYFCKKFKGAGIEIDIVRDTFTALKATVWKDFYTILTKHNIYEAANHNKTDHIYNLFGNFINYYGADTPEKIHGRSRDILWINEAHQFPSETIDQLFPRTRHKIIADYNPALGLEHWLDDYIDEYPPLITTYKDNPFLTQAQINEIESRKDNKYWWSVYGEGVRANREGVIFENWTTGEFNTNLVYCYGQDFGFTNDPTTLIKVAVDQKHKKIYLHQCYFSEGLTTEQIYTSNKHHIEKQNDLIVADSAEPRLINEVRKLGLNIIGVTKGAGSVLFRLTKMQEYEIIITPQSKNLKREFSMYIWNDKRAGIPIDKYNHGIDAAGYAFIRLTTPSGMGNFMGQSNLH